ncbi:MAG: hypothetical protein JNG89_19390, partial [Planctomycetaceae bacterium]|nr:hypothetical protein [Planctomycetaceae bacterium]
MDTRWRIVWGVEQHGGRSEVLYIREAHFQRGPGSPEIQVLGDCRLAEIFVPYNGGTRIYDISNYTFPLITLDPSFLGPVCVGPGVIYDREGVPRPSGPVASEVHDGQLRWINGANKHRRGQSIAVWSVLSAGNYRYIMLYQFRDDGVVSFRLGATAHNLFDSDGDGTTHLHTGWWRLNVVLGAAARTQVSLVELDTSALSSAVTLLGKESRLEWNAERFSRLRVESLVHFNAHSPSHPIGYELIPMRQGNGRYLGVGEEFTQ